MCPLIRIPSIPWCADLQAVLTVCPFRRKTLRRAAEVSLVAGPFTSFSFEFYHMWKDILLPPTIHKV